MTPEQLRRLDDLFHAVQNVAEDQRARWVESVCADDLELKHELTALLRHARPSGRIGTEVLRKLLRWPAAAMAGSRVRAATSATRPRRRANRYPEASTPASLIWPGRRSSTTDGAELATTTAPLPHPQWHPAATSRLVDALDWEPGDVLFGRYQVEQCLRGGMAKVYVCRSKPAGSRVVLKVPRVSLQPDSASAPASRLPIAAELGAWGRVGSHPYIVRLIDAIAWRAIDLRDGSADVPWTLEFAALIIEYAGPCSLHEYMSSRHVSLGHKLAMLTQIALGMLHMQQQGITAHLDLKPQNVLVGEDQVARVTDFGLARVGALASGTASAMPSTASAGLGVPDPVCGTPAYMAPEQWIGLSRCDVRTDIYAFGVLAVEVLAGAHPFHEAMSGDLESVRRAHAEQTPHVAAVPAIAELIASCLEKDPADRPQSWEHVLEALPSEIAAGSRAAAAAAPPRDRDLLHHAVFLRQFERVRSILERPTADLRGTRELVQARTLLRLEEGRRWSALAGALGAATKGRPVGLDLFTACCPHSLVQAMCALFLLGLCLLQLVLTARFLGVPIPHPVLAVCLGLALAFESRRFLPCPNCRTRRWWNWERSAPRNRAAAAVGPHLLDAVAVCRTCGMVRGEVSTRKSPPRPSLLTRIDTTSTVSVSCVLPRMTLARRWGPAIAFGRGAAEHSRVMAQGGRLEPDLPTRVVRAPSRSSDRRGRRPPTLFRPAAIVLLAGSLLAGGPFIAMVDPVRDAGLAGSIASGAYAMAVWCVLALVFTLAPALVACKLLRSNRAGNAVLLLTTMLFVIVCIAQTLPVTPDLDDIERRQGVALARMRAAIDRADTNTAAAARNEGIAIWRDASARPGALGRTARVTADLLSHSAQLEDAYNAALAAFHGAGGWTVPDNSSAAEQRLAACRAVRQANSSLLEAIESFPRNMNDRLAGATVPRSYAQHVERGLAAESAWRDLTLQLRQLDGQVWDAAIEQFTFLATHPGDWSRSADGSLAFGGQVTDLEFERFAQSQQRIETAVKQQRALLQPAEKQRKPSP